MNSIKIIIDTIKKLNLIALIVDRFEKFKRIRFEYIDFFYINQKYIDNEFIKNNFEKYYYNYFKLKFKK